LLRKEDVTFPLNWYVAKRICPHKTLLLAYIAENSTDEWDVSTDQAARLTVTCPLRVTTGGGGFVPLSLLRTDLAPSAGTLAPA
jgi:hypothetical protein